MTLMKTAVLMIVFCLLAVMATASYNFDGFQLNTTSSGSVYGGVFVSYGDKSGLDSSPYTTSYNLPAGNVSLGRLYVGVWGGNEGNTGWVNTTLNNIVVGNTSLAGTVDTNPTYSEGTNVYSSGNGVWWVSYNVKNNMTMGSINTAIARTSGTIDGRVYCIVLAAAYNDTDGAGLITQYWINEGNVNLHGNDTEHPWVLDNTTAQFNGNLDSKYSNARLNTVYLTGTTGEPDYLYFNSVEDYHRLHQLGDDGNETIGSDDIARGLNYFDFLNFDVTNLINPNNNFASFWRGHDSNHDGWISADLGISGLEGESYVHPVLSVMTVNTTRTHLTRNLVVGAANIFSLPLADNEDISSALSSIQSEYTYVYRYNPTLRAWQTYNKNKPNPPYSPFNKLDPGVGYSVTPENACILEWNSK
jgi:hypothetical protein